MKGPENKFKDKIKKRLNLFPNSYHFTKEAVSLRVIPDIIGCSNGKFFALEVKASRNSNKTEMQKHILEKIKRAGSFASFIYPENEEEVLTALYEWCTTLR